VEEVDDWETEVDDILERFTQETGRAPTYDLCWY
jgi:hypothetical protein